MKEQHRQMVNTRRLYKLETSLYDNKVFNQLTKQRSLKFLRELTEFIWHKERFARDVPEVRFGNGYRYGKLACSWCDGITVELIETQQDVLTLIHELVHALGYGDHDELFVEMEVYLLMKYTPLNPQLLIDTFNPLITK